MILAIAMALVTRTYGGQMSVVPNLSAHDCAEAQSVALYGKSVEQEAIDDATAAAVQKAVQAKEDAAQSAWESAHPANAKRCHAQAASTLGVIWPGTGCGPRYESTVFHFVNQADGDIKRAECVQ